MTTHTLLGVRGLEKAFDGRPVLRGVDLEIGKCEIFGLLGSNGAGKTTTINVITGLLSPDAGVIERHHGSHDVEWRGRIGVAPQEVAVYPRLTCAENIAFFGGLYGLRYRDRKRCVDRMISVTHLETYRDVRASKLSGGTRRRLNLAIALAHGPDLLILDEPTAGLDIESRYSLWSVIRDLRLSGTSVLLTTHLLDEAAALCDRIAILHRGRIEREGTLDQLLGTVPARTIVEVVSDDEGSVYGRAADLGLAIRKQGGRLALLFVEETTLEAIVQSLSGTGVRSVSLRPVTLEDVYFDATQG